ncbi:MAG: CRISPR-associated endonuclease Cas4g/Cas1g [Nitrospiraceae bacterium]
MESNGTTVSVEEPLLPVRMLNEFTYCPRLAYLEWVQGEFRDSADTVEGRFHHRRVDHAPARAAAIDPVESNGDAKEEPIHQRSVWLSSERLGITAKIDLVEGIGACVAPVDYKRGKRPHVHKGAWDPERVQLCAQGLVLRDNGWECDGGFLYFVGSRERVAVSFDQELIEQTLSQIEAMRRMAREGAMPPPLVDSPKCPRCSLVGICLPDEVGWLHGGQSSDGAVLRRLIPTKDDALPLYVQHPGARVSKDGDCLKVLDRDTVVAEARLVETSHLVLLGKVQVSTQAIHALCDRGIPISYLSSGGWFYGLTTGMTHKNIELRRRQYAAAANPDQCLTLARRIVQAKIANCRTVLRRNHAAAPEMVLRDLKTDQQNAGQAESLPSLLGIEGTAARRYFSEFAGMLKTESHSDFDFEGRNRRPPRDPVNALLSFAYALLTREWTLTVQAVGLDPYLGFYHQPRYGRPALALDLMEEFRPLIADSVVLTAVNNGEVRPTDWIVRMGAVALTPEGRRRFIETYERRMGQEISHPVFGYQISYRRVLEVQARLLGRYLLGEIPEYPSFTTR